MAITLFSSFLPNVLSQVPGVPITVVDTQVRFAATEFCRYTGAWVEDLTPIASVKDQAEYSIVSNESVNGLVRTIRQVYYDKTWVAPQDIKTLRKEHPTHPDAASSGIPYKYAMVDRDTMTLFPIPSTAIAGVLKVRATIIPKTTSNGLDAGVAEDYEETIISGALFRLMSMPNKSWTSVKTAEYHGRKFRSEMTMARARIEKGFTDTSLQVDIPNIIPNSISIRRAV